MIGTCPNGTTQCMWFGAGGCQTGVCALATAAREDGGKFGGVISHEFLGLTPPVQSVSLEALTGIKTEALK